jgi:hypothetical protein
MIVGPSFSFGIGILALKCLGAAQGGRCSLSLVSTFRETQDNAPRRTADNIAS